MSGPDTLRHTTSRELLLLAVDNGWSAALSFGMDTGDNPYISVTAQRDRDEIRLTWHTRQTGTYRLFSAIARTNLNNWHDITLTKARDMLAADRGAAA